jgi:hypothetical protein
MAGSQQTLLTRYTKRLYNGNVGASHHSHFHPNPDIFSLRSANARALGLWHTFTAHAVHPTDELHAPDERQLLHNLILTPKGKAQLHANYTGG